MSFFLNPYWFVTGGGGPPDRWPATLENGAIWAADRPSVLSGTYSLDLDGVNDDAVFAGSSDGPLNAIDTGDFTVAGWAAKTSSTGSYEFFIANWSTTGLMFGVSSGGLVIAYIGDPTENTSTQSMPSDGTWVHWAITRASGTVKFFKDGSQVNTMTASGTLSSSMSSYLGYRPATGQNFKGHLADWRIYNRALSGSEISDLSAGTHVSSGLTAWWLLDEGSGSIAHDSTP